MTTDGWQETPPVRRSHAARDISYLVKRTSLCQQQRRSRASLVLAHAIGGPALPPRWAEDVHHGDQQGEEAHERGVDDERVEVAHVGDPLGHFE
nr:hypothetical protein CFP56_13010 [Quercus suber]